MSRKSIVIIIFIILMLNIFMNLFIIKKSKAAETSTIYVDNTFYTRRDGSAEHPLASIQDAIDIANDGDTIYVYGGYYTENLIINKKLKLWGSIERGDTIIDSRFDVRYFVQITSDQVEFQKFTINDTNRILTSPIGALLCIKASNVVVQSNTINHSNAYGIYVDPISTGNFISGNTINDTKNGIVISSSYNNDIVSNTLYNCSDSAIYLSSCDNNRIYENTLYYNKIGVKIEDSTGINISDNSIMLSDLYGIFIDNDKSDLIFSNNFYNNIGYGMYLNLFDSEIFENNFNNNSRGITLAGSNCKIYDNLISNSTGTGIYTISSSYSHILYLNEFINNTPNAQEYGDNQWYNHLLEKGNYWSDYEGIDLIPNGSGDGIGDTYYIQDKIIDKFPLGFFTKPPNKPSNPIPNDLKENVGLEITLQVTVSDPDGDKLTAYFYRGDTNTLIRPDAVVKKIPSGGKASFNFIQGFDTAFTWYVIVNDSKLENKSETWIFTTKSAPPDNKPPIVKPGGPYVGVNNYPLPFDGSKSYDPDGNIVLYRWNFGDDTSEILSGTPLHTYLKPGIYTVILTVVDNNRTCATNTTTVTIYGTTYNVNPSPNAGGPYIGKVSDLVIFDGSKSYDEDGTIKNYTWSFNDGKTYYGQIASRTFTSAGPYIVTLTVTDNFGGKNSTFTQVTIQPADDSQSPGFEFIVTISVLIMILLWKRKRT